MTISTGATGRRRFTSANKPERQSEAGSMGRLGFLPRDFLPVTFARPHLKFPITAPLLCLLLCATRAKELAHDLGAFGFHHAGYYFESMVQPSVAADIIYGPERARFFVACAVYHSL